MNTFSTFVNRNMYIVRPQGEIVARSYPEFERELLSRLTEGTQVLFNMRDTTFIDSAGIVFLLRIMEIVEASGDTFVMYNLNDRAKRVLKRLNIERLLNVRESVEECFGSGSGVVEELMGAGAVAV